MLPNLKSRGKGTERSIATREGKRQNAVRAATVMARVPQEDANVGNYYDVWPAPSRSKKLGGPGSGTGLVSQTTGRRIPLRNLDTVDDDDQREQETQRCMSPVEGRGGMERLKLSDTIPIPRDNNGLFPGADQDLFRQQQKQKVPNSKKPSPRRTNTTAPVLLGPGSGSQNQNDPKLLKTLRALISTGLASVSLKFPSLENPREPPPHTTAATSRIDDNLDVFYKTECQYETPFANEIFQRAEDEFAAARLDVFLQAADALCNSFKTYAPILKWIFAEHHRFIHFTVGLLRQERHALETERGDLRRETRNLHDYVSGLERDNEDLTLRLEEAQAMCSGLEESAANAKKAEEDALYKAQSAHNLVEAQEKEKATLAKHILKVEREVTELAEAAEGPAKSILTLKSQLIIKEELIKKMGELNERASQDNTNLRRQLTLVNGARSSSEVVPRNVKKIEQDLHEAAKRERHLNDVFHRLTSEANQYKNEVELLEELQKQNSAARYDPKTSTVLTPRVRIHSNLLSDVNSSGGKLMEAVNRLEKQQATIKNLEAHLTGVAHLRNLSMEDMRKHVKGDKLPLVVPRSHEVHRKWFAGLGLDNQSVPAYLRCDGRIKNMRLTLKMTHGIIRCFRSTQNFGDIDPSSVAGLPKDQRLQMMLCAKYADEASAVGYSLHHALQVHDLDPEVYLFREILEGRVDEEVYHSQVRAMQGVKRMMLEKNKRNQELNMSKLVMCRALAKHFLPQSEEDVGRLFTAMRIDQPGEGVDVNKLFQDPLARPSNFVSAIFNLLTIDREKYLNAVEAQLLEDPNVSSAVVSPLALVSAFLKVDPEFPPELLHIRICTLFKEDLSLSKLEGLPLADRYGELANTLPLPDLLKQLRRGDFQRYSREPVAEEKPPVDLDEDGCPVSLNHELVSAAAKAIVNGGATAAATAGGGESPGPQDDSVAVPVLDADTT